MAIEMLNNLIDVTIIRSHDKNVWGNVSTVGMLSAVIPHKDITQKYIFD